MVKHNLALTDEQAFELLAFLVTSAQDCLSESPHYGVYRLLSAAEHLASSWRPRAPAPMLDLLDELISRTGPEGAKRDMDPEGYKSFIAEVCRRIAQEVKRRGQEGAVVDVP